MNPVIYAVLLLLPVCAYLGVASAFRAWRSRHTDDPAMEGLIRDGRLNYSYSKHAPFGSYDYEKASASHKQAQVLAKKRMQTVEARERKEKAKLKHKVTQLRKAQ